MAAERVLLERREDLLERPLADLANAPRRELVPIAILADEAGLLEELSHATELVQGLARGRTRETLDLLAVERLEIVGVARGADRVLHVRDLVHLIHESERLGPCQRLI